VRPRFQPEAERRLIFPWHGECGNSLLNCRLHCRLESVSDQLLIKGIARFTARIRGTHNWKLCVSFKNKFAWLNGVEER
jgi:hypothetical protein